ncbi:MAG TPA: efflux RND transporter periplasmic adaptor subunit [Candidatus Polarisedimenticolaceae bacterium]|nr:efflux RND transporter periplasmic adaptor subunit [Candidatus Polarisedimenticolaceae bacterium]
MTKRRKVVWVGVLLAVVVVAAVIVGAAMSRGPKAKPVQMSKIDRQDLQAKVSANGKIQATKKVDISATVPGQVVQLAVKEGDVVKKGQFLLQLDPANYRASARGSQSSMEALQKELDAAVANLEQAKADFTRAERNHAAGILADADLQRAKTAVTSGEASILATQHRIEQAHAAVDGSTDTLSKTTIRAPMDGVVTAKRIEEGEVAVIGVQNQPGTVLLTISDMSVVEAEMEIDETSIPSVALGQAARIHIDAYPNQTFDGAVTEVGNSPITTAVGAAEAIKFKVKVQLKNPPPGIKPGLSVQADILTGFRSKVLTVPLQAMVVRDAPATAGEPKAAGPPKEEEGVYVVESGKVVFKAIKTGLLGELSIEVVDGIKEGETLVTGPFRVLRDLKAGDLVRAEKPDESGPPRG